MSEEPDTNVVLDTMIESYKAAEQTVKDEDLPTLIKNIEAASHAYTGLEIPADTLAALVEEKQIILNAHSHLNTLRKLAAEAKVAQLGAKANGAFKEVRAELLKLKGNTDYPKIFVVNMPGSPAKNIKQLLNKTLPKDRYIHGKQVKLFGPKNRFYMGSFTGVGRSYLDDMLLLRLTENEAMLAKLAMADKLIIVDDPDATKWLSAMIAAQVSNTTLDATDYDNEVQALFKLYRAYIV